MSRWGERDEPYPDAVAGTKGGEAVTMFFEGKAFDNSVPVPAIVAKCPECGGVLHVQVNEWDAETGVPTEFGVDVDCERDDLGEDDPQNPHRWWQGEWMDTLDKVRAWSIRFVRKAVR